MFCLQFSDLDVRGVDLLGFLIWCGLYNTVVRFGLPSCFVLAFVSLVDFGI